MTEKDITKMEGILFLIDNSALRDMINGDEKSKGKELLNKLKQMKDEGKEVNAVTPLSCLLRAIWTAEPTSTINDLQKLLSFLEIRPSFSNFKNEKEVTDEVLMIAQNLSGKKK